MSETRISGSFRDPSGFLFSRNGKLYRQINESYKKDYDMLKSSGLYDELVAEKLLISHKESKRVKRSGDGYLVIEPEIVPFISYPYEWSFSQYMDAALTTLEVQRRVLTKGMILKDASAYNIQFVHGQPLLIDTLSFEIYEAGEPWIAYKQFCQHFLAPLALMAHVDVDLSKLMRIYIDGVPLQLASKILPGKTKASSLLAHIHLHARSQQKYADKGGKTREVTMSKQAQLGIISSLAKAIKKLERKPAGTEWGDYYTFTNYSDKSFKQKQKLVKEFIEKTKPKTVWDIGANDGSFSRLASNMGIVTVALDIDPIAVEKNYRQVKSNQEQNILPLVMDLTNPSASIGWANSERDSLIKRGPADTILALALVHHLAISNNVPLEKVAQFLASIGKNVIIEFVPKGDSQVDKLLATREDVFPDYNEKGFELAFSKTHKFVTKKAITGTKRTLYLLARK